MAAKTASQQEREQLALLTALCPPPLLSCYVSSVIKCRQKLESDLCGRPGDEPGLVMV